MTRIVLALVAGAALVVFAAVTIGEYPLSAADIWLAAVIVPALLGSIMSTIARRRRAFWLAAGPLAGGAVGWGIGISTTWGIEPVPVDAWFALVFATLWPIGWGALMFSRPASTSQRALTPQYPGSTDGKLSDTGHVRGSEIGDP